MRCGGSAALVFEFKTPSGANVAVDFWAGDGKRTHGDGLMKLVTRWQTWLAFVRCQPNLRNVPFVIDPFAIRTLTLLCGIHQGPHVQKNAAHVVNNNMTTTDEEWQRFLFPLLGSLRTQLTFGLAGGVPREAVHCC